MIKTTITYRFDIFLFMFFLVPYPKGFFPYTSKTIDFVPDYLVIVIVSGIL